MADRLLVALQWEVWIAIAPKRRQLQAFPSVCFKVLALADIANAIEVV